MCLEALVQVTGVDSVLRSLGGGGEEGSSEIGGGSGDGMDVVGGGENYKGFEMEILIEDPKMGSADYLDDLEPLGSTGRGYSIEYIDGLLGVLSGNDGGGGVAPSSSSSSGEPSEDDKELQKKLESDTNLQKLKTTSIGLLKRAKQISNMITNNNERLKLTSSSSSSSTNLNCTDTTTTLQTTIILLTEQNKALKFSRDEHIRKSHGSQRKLDKLYSGVSVKEIMKDEGTENDSGRVSPRIQSSEKNGGSSEKKVEGNASSSSTTTATTDANGSSEEKGGETVSTAQHLKEQAATAKAQAEISSLNVTLEQRKQKIEEMAKNNELLNLRINKQAEEKSNTSVIINVEEVKNTHMFQQLNAAYNAQSFSLNQANKALNSLTSKYSNAKGKLVVVEKAVKDVSESKQVRLKELLEGRDEAIRSKGKEVNVLKSKVSTLEEEKRNVSANAKAVEEIKAQVNELMEENKRLRKTWEDNFKSRRTNTVGEDGEVNSSFGDTTNMNVEQLRANNELLRQALVEASNMESVLTSEMDSVLKEKEELGNRNKRLTKQNSEKEQISLRTVKEVINLKQSLETVREEKNLLKLQVAERVAISEAHGKVIANNKRIEGEYTNEINRKDAEIQKLKDDIFMGQEDKARVVEAQRVIEEGRKGVLDEKAKVAQRSEELVKSLTEEKSKVNQVEEELALCKHEVTKLKSQKAEMKSKLGEGGGGKGGPSLAEQANQQLLNEYRNKVMCHICHAKEKTTCITRCMHMFCKECIATRVANRSRKCPACQMSFAKEDVKDMWLT